MDTARILLEQLLKKYESSKAFTEEQPVRRRIQLNVYKGEFKPYDIEDYEQKIHIHQVVQALQAEGFLDFDWVRGEERHILHRIWLKLDQVDKAYDRAGLVSPKKEAKSVGAVVDQAYAEWQDAARPDGQGVETETGWIGKVLLDMRDVLKRRQRLAAPLPAGQEQAMLLVTALRQLIRLQPDQEELAERVFSIQAFGDSKTFEQQVRARLASLIRRYLLPELLDQPAEQLDDLDLAEDELLGLVNLVKAPEIFEFSGPLYCVRSGRRLDLSFFTSCATLSSAELHDLRFELPLVIRRILFVENRTNFHWLVQRRSQNEDWHDTLLVYHGGCFSPVRERFFRLLKDAVDRAELKIADNSAERTLMVYHWGDIDLGGYFIFNRLRQCCFPRLLPWHMDRSDLLSSLGQAQPISKAYAARLQALLADDRFAVFHPVIELSLEKGVRLEQEALLGRL